jgi:hypothetical protein
MERVVSRGKDNVCPSLVANASYRLCAIATLPSQNSGAALLLDSSLFAVILFASVWPR